MTRVNALGPFGGAGKEIANDDHVRVGPNGGVGHSFDTAREAPESEASRSVASEMTSRQERQGRALRVCHLVDARQIVASC